jgi:SAM-dependent methyltransferase
MTALAVLGWAVVALAGLAALATLGVYAWCGAPPVPSSRGAVEATASLMPHRVRRCLTVYELGCGHGRLLYGLAERFPRHRFVGFEISPIPFLVAWARSRRARWRGRVTVRWANFYRSDLSGADVAVCYLMIRPMQRLRPKFEAELASGSLVISHTFSVHGWRPQKEVRARDLFRTPVYLYRMPPEQAAPPSST